jgi:hypothetical protein
MERVSQQRGRNCASSRLDVRPHAITAADSWVWPAADAAAAYACDCVGNAREENRVTGSLQVSRAVSHPLKARQSFVELEACVAHHEADSSDRTRPTDVECTHNARVLRNGRGERETL